MATLLYGGAFNPITHGHLLTAREAMERGYFDKVIFIPTGHEGYKGGIAPFQHRLEMLKLAIAGQDAFEVSEWEGEQAKLGHKSYTIDTFRHMRDSSDDKDLWWLIGSDNISNIATWNNFEAIKEEMKVVVVPRPGYPITERQQYMMFDRLGLKWKSVLAPTLDISSTYVRDRVRLGRTIRYLVPKEVEDYIYANELYGAEPMPQSDFSDVRAGTDCVSRYNSHRD